jgi:hypothetical protein
MSWLKAVSVLALRVRGLLDTVRPTQRAGLVSPEPMTPHGSLPFALDTNHQRQPALTPQSQSSDHAPSTSTGQKLGSEKQTASAGRVLTAAGSKSPIPARQRRQPAKQALKHAKKVASQIKAAAKRTPAQAPAQTHTVSPSGALGN